ncbi:MAG: ABC transporter permease [Phycisphaerae bacterium]
MGVVLGVLPIVLLCVLWWYVTAGAPEERIVNRYTLPAPGEVFQLDSSDANEGLTPGALVHHLLLSLKRVALGYLVAVAVVVPLGILMGSFSSIRAMFSPLATASGYIPIATLVPLTFAWWGIDEKQKVYFLAIAFGIYLLPTVIRAIDGVPDIYLRTASTLGASRLQLVLRILVPVALPDIWQGMRLAFGVGWTYLVLAEVVVRNGGLGDVIEMSRRRAKPGQVFLIIILITLVAWVADLVWVYLGRLLFPYKKASK